MNKRKNKLQGDIGVFLKQYERKAYPNSDPNDRHYDREIENKVKNMSPNELSEMMYDQGDEISEDEEEEWFKGNPISGVKFALNDPVQLLRKNRPELRSIVTLIQVRPVPKYVVELGSGRDVEVFEAELQLIST